MHFDLNHVSFFCTAYCFSQANVSEHEAFFYISDAAEMAVNS